MSRNFKIFLWSGIPFGLAMGVWFSQQYGSSTGLKIGIIAGLTFGALIFIILGLLHSQAVKKIRGGNSRETLSTHQVSDIELNLPYKQTFDLCMQSLSRIKRCTIQEENLTQGRIVAWAGINWKTWGDIITFHIKKTTNGITYVTISSRPRARTTLVDFGKNLENIIKVTSFLKKHAESGSRERLK
jgi:hypothetical protein